MLAQANLKALKRFIIRTAWFSYVIVYLKAHDSSQRGAVCLFYFQTSEI